MERIADMVARSALTAWSTFRSGRSTSRWRNPARRRIKGQIPRIGIRPSYGDAGEGVLLGGVSDGGPAEKAGMKEGDRIVEIGGKPVKNLEGYMVLIAAHKKGEPVEARRVARRQKAADQGQDGVTAPASGAASARRVLGERRGVSPPC